MDNVPGKSVAHTRIQEDVYRIFPNDLNVNGTVFGGLVMSTLDRLAHIVAERHSEKTCVTASVDSMHFLAPARKGDNLIFCLSANRSWTSSLEIGAKVYAEDGKTMKRKHILSAYFTFVALDSNQKPTSIPRVIPETKIEKARYEEANLRRQARFKMKDMMQKHREKNR